MTARSRLGSNAPGYAALVFGLELVEHEGIDTMATDGKSIFWSREFIQKIDDREIMGVLMHEGLHVMLGHHLRRGKINPTLWNVACDYAINIVVRDAREPLPKGALYDDQYRGLSAHQIVKKLGNDQKEDQGKPKDGEGEGDAEGQPTGFDQAGEIWDAVDGDGELWHSGILCDRRGGGWTR